VLSVTEISQLFDALAMDTRRNMAKAPPLKLDSRGDCIKHAQGDRRRDLINPWVSIRPEGPAGRHHRRCKYQRSITRKDTC